MSKKHVKESDGVIRVEAKFLKDDSHRNRVRGNQIKKEVLNSKKILRGDTRLNFRQDALIGVGYAANKWNVKPETVKELIRKNFHELNVELLRP